MFTCTVVTWLLLIHLYEQLISYQILFGDIILVILTFPLLLYSSLCHAYLHM